MSSLRIRPARVTDAAEAAALLRASITDLCHTDHGGDAQAIANWTANKTTQTVAGWITAAPDRMFAACLDAGIAGFGGFSASGEVLLAYVAPEHRFQGVTSALLARLEAEIAGRGHRTGRLTSIATARRFYTARGWQGTEGSAETGHPMAKPLPAIRRLEARDAALWRAIRLDALATAPGAFAARHDDWAERPLSDFAAHLAEVPVLVAEAGGSVAGCAELTPDTGLANRAWVESVYVRPDARGQGVADALLAGLAHQARSAGLSELLLDVAAANASARRAYARAGYAQLDERPKGSNDACEITLRLALA